jgi:hypothetical protein
MKYSRFQFLTKLFSRLRRLFDRPAPRRSRKQPARRSWNSLGRTISAERLEVRWTPSASPIAAHAVPISGFENAPLGTVPVATFTAGDGTAPPSSFTAVISWGDGTTTTGNVGESGTTYIVAGSHTYADLGNYSVVVGIVEGGSAPSFAVGQASIKPLLPDGTQGTADQRYVYEVLKDTLQRPISMNDVNYWTGQFLKNGEDRQTFAYILLEVTPPYEYRRNEINAAYEQYLHRPADPVGEEYFLNLVNSSQGIHSGPGLERRTSAILISSQEFYANSGGTDQGFVTSIFQDALHRNPDGQALAFYVGELQAGYTHVEIATQILNSTEALTNNVQNLYQRYLGRPADPVGLQNFLFNYQNGYGTENNTETLLTTDEFYNRAIGDF